MKNTRECNHEISICDWRRKPTILRLSGICKKFVVFLSTVALFRLAPSHPSISVFFLTYKNDFNEYLSPPRTGTDVHARVLCPHRNTGPATQLWCTLIFHCHTTRVHVH